MTRTALYRHHDADGALLYIGISENPQRRSWEHACTAEWASRIARTSVEWHDNRISAQMAERHVVASQKPEFNLHGQSSTAARVGDDLLVWMARESVTRDDLASAYGITLTSICRIINGSRKASLHFAIFIEDMSQGAVPARYWLDRAHSPERAAS